MKTIIVFLCILITACSKKNVKASLPDIAPLIDAQKAGVAVKAATVERNTSDLDITKKDKPNLLKIPASLKADEKSSLSFQTSGVFRKNLKKAGDYVRKGDVLAKLDNTQQILNLEDARIDLKSKEISFHLGEKKLERAQEQLKMGVISQNSFENEKNTFDNLKLEWERSKTRIKSKQYELSLTQLTAPFSGVISNLYKSLGDSVGPGVNVFDIVSNNSLTLYSQIPVNYYKKVSVGMSLRIHDPISGANGEVTIKRIVPVFDPAQYTFDVYAEIKKFDRPALAGDYIEIQLPI